MATPAFLELDLSPPPSPSAPLAVQNRVTASATARRERCGYWARAGVPWSDVDNEWTRGGNIVDGVLTALVHHAAFPTPIDSIASESVRAMARNVIGWYEDHGRDDMRAQTVFAWDPATDTAIEVEVPEGAPHRPYADQAWRAQLGIAPSALCGTTDLLWVDEDARGRFLEIRDLKCEFGLSKDHLPQLTTLALLACRAYGISRARVAAVRVREDGASEDAGTWLDEFDLLEIAETHRAHIASASTSEPTPGPWCSDLDCPAIVACPATQRDIASAEKLVPAKALVKRDRPFTIAFEGPNHIANMVARARALIDASEKVIAAATDAVAKAGGAIALEDELLGKELRAMHRNMPRLNRAALEKLARAKGATDEEIALCIPLVREGAGLRVVNRKAPEAAAGAEDRTQEGRGDDRG